MKPTDKQADVVVAAQGLLNAIDKNARVGYAFKLLKALVDEVEGLRDERDGVYVATMIAVSEGEESELRAIQECDKCDLREDHHGN